MTLERFEVGIVSRDCAAVDFLDEVFQLEELPASEYGAGPCTVCSLPVLSSR